MGESVSLLKGWRARWDLNPGSPAPQAGVIIRTIQQARSVFARLNFRAEK